MIPAHRIVRRGCVAFLFAASAHAQGDGATDRSARETLGRGAAAAFMSGVYSKLSADLARLPERGDRMPWHVRLPAQPAPLWQTARWRLFEALYARPARSDEPGGWLAVDSAAVRGDGLVGAFTVGWVFRCEDGPTAEDRRGSVTAYEVRSRRIAEVWEAPQVMKLRDAAAEVPCASHGRGP